MSRNWIAHSQPLRFGIHAEQPSISTYRLNHQFPIIAVIGMFRPRLFIANQLFERLSVTEFSAAISHECGHLAARDNLRRVILKIRRDVLTIVPCGRALDDSWNEASEEAADEYVCRSGGNSALDLASALVKITRMVPEGLKPATILNASMIIDDTGANNRRINRLLELATKDKAESSPASRAAFILDSPYLLGFTALLFAAVSIAARLDSPTSIHKLIAVAVSTLQ